MITVRAHRSAPQPNAVRGGPSCCQRCRLVARRAQMVGSGMSHAGFRHIQLEAAEA
jgi:hypothetical protein